jgi:hypothetical protein
MRIAVNAASNVWTRSEQNQWSQATTDMQKDENHTKHSDVIRGEPKRLRDAASNNKQDNAVQPERIYKIR